MCISKLKAFQNVGFYFSAKKPKLCLNQLDIISMFHSLQSDPVFSFLNIRIYILSFLAEGRFLLNLYDFKVLRMQYLIKNKVDES